MRLPSVPDPRELVGDLAGLLPRAMALVGGAEKLLRDVDALVRRIEGTRSDADVVVADVARTVGRADVVVDEVGRTVARAEVVVDEVSRTVARAEVLIDRLEPPLLRLMPVLDRLAETTDPREVDALVALVDLLPGLVSKLETDIVPILESLGSVAPDLHDLLDTSAELNEMLAKLPGMGRVKKRVEEKQAEEGRG